jgi:DNA-binding XRE family transcriptional regulator
MSAVNNRVVREKLKSLRQQKGTQRKVANDLGITETALRMIENGYFTPSGKTMAKISKYLEAPVQELFPDVFN